MKLKTILALIMAASLTACATMPVKVNGASLSEPKTAEPSSVPYSIIAIGVIALGALAIGSKGSKGDNSAVVTCRAGASSEQAWQSCG